MPKLPRISGATTIEALGKFGFVPVRQRCSHVILKRKTPAGEIGCVVPLHNELATGTLRSILRQAQVDPDQFIAAL
jgi:predicted RNA binding protein YcfA (HicA-like mRNA interferase family)